MTEHSLFPSIKDAPTEAEKERRRRKWAESCCKLTKVYLDQETGSIHLFPWRCKQFRVCSRCFDIRRDHYQRRLHRAFHLASGQIHHAVIEDADWASLRNRLGRYDMEYLQFPLQGKRIAIFYEDGSEPSTLSYPAVRFNDISPELLDQLVNTPKQRRISGRLGKGSKGESLELIEVGTVAAPLEVVVQEAEQLSSEPISEISEGHLCIYDLDVEMLLENLELRGISIYRTNFYTETLREKRETAFALT